MFKVNQQVVCTKRGNWKYTDPFAAEVFPEPPFGPKFNEVVTVSSIFNKREGVYLVLSEYVNHHYSAKWFEPLVHDSVLEEELSKISEHILA